MFNIINKFNGTDREINVDVEETNEHEVDVENENEVEHENENEVEVEVEDEDEVVEEETGVPTQTEEEDDDETVRKYVISVDGIPFYYHNDLETARRYMWSIGNNFITPKKEIYDLEDEIDEYYITTNDLNNIKIMKTYDFFFFTYSSIVNELKIDYVIPCKI